MREEFRMPGQVEVPQEDFYAPHPEPEAEGSSSAPLSSLSKFGIKTRRAG